MTRIELSDAEWELLECCLPEAERSGAPPRRGRPFGDARVVMLGVLWVLVSGARWEDCPAEYGSYKTVHRRYLNWCQDGTFARAFALLLQRLQQEKVLDLSEGFIDGSFAPAKKGGARSAKPSAEKAPNSWS